MTQTKKEFKIGENVHCTETFPNQVKIIENKAIIPSRTK